jgi:hypothetical protein
MCLKHQTRINVRVVAYSRMYDDFHGTGSQSRVIYCAMHNIVHFCKVAKKYGIRINLSKNKKTKQKTPWPESPSELYQPSDRRLSAKLLPTFADRTVSHSQWDGTILN